MPADPRPLTPEQRAKLRNIQPGMARLFPDAAESTIRSLLDALDAAEAEAARLRAALEFVRAWCESERDTPAKNQWQHGHREAALCLLSDSRIQSALAPTPEPGREPTR